MTDRPVRSLGASQVRWRIDLIRYAFVSRTSDSRPPVRASTSTRRRHGRRCVGGSHVARPTTVPSSDRPCHWTGHRSLMTLDALGAILHTPLPTAISVDGNGQQSPPTSIVLDLLMVPTFYSLPRAALRLRRRRSKKTDRLVPELHTAHRPRTINSSDKKWPLRDRALPERSRSGLFLETTKFATPIPSRPACPGRRTARRATALWARSEHLCQTDSLALSPG